VAAAGLAVAVTFWPRRKTVLQVAALAAAVTIAVQLTAGHWFYFYVVWFLPFLLVVSFASHRAIALGSEDGRP
jgi:choline-glycine betaine transporter